MFVFIHVFFRIFYHLIFIEMCVDLISNVSPFQLYLLLFFSPEGCLLFSLTYVCFFARNLRGNTNECRASLKIVRSTVIKCTLQAFSQNVWVAKQVLFIAMQRSTQCSITNERRETKKKSKIKWNKFGWRCKWMQFPSTCLMSFVCSFSMFNFFAPVEINATSLNGVRDAH